MNDIPPELKDNLPGLGGALITSAAFLMKRQWVLSGVMFVVGSTLGYFFGGELGRMWKISPEAGSAVMASVGSISVWKLIEGIINFDTKKAGRELWLALLRKTGLRK